VQRVLEADVRRGQLVDDARVEVVAPREGMGNGWAVNADPPECEVA
jgi:hypothetical protein